MTAKDERERRFYQTVRSFDQTVEGPAGAVGEESLPFGVEYRGSMVMREVNVGYADQPGTLAFGKDVEVPDGGFCVCEDCGVVVGPEEKLADVRHRSSCRGRKRTAKMAKEGKSGHAYKWQHVFLYRELRSEALRLLLPIVDDSDLETLVSAIYLGLRLRFEGDPAHLIVAPQIIPDRTADVDKHYLVLMDAVPGGTGYLKALFQERDDQDRLAEGVVDVMRRALVALETCSCRKLKDVVDKEDPDGCYRCLRTYQMQYAAESVSRERGIELLQDLVKAGEARETKKTLQEIKPDSLFGSQLEKKFVEALKNFVVAERGGQWEDTIIRGGRGFRFRLGQDAAMWELELQPLLGAAQGVDVACQPDFMLRSDAREVLPIAVFTDGFKFHCHPVNRLADDFRKRRAIRDSGNYHVWNVTWDDVKALQSTAPACCHPQLVPMIARYCANSGARLKRVRAADATAHGMRQLLAYLDAPDAGAWRELATVTASIPLTMLQEKPLTAAELSAFANDWNSGGTPQRPDNPDGDWVLNERATINNDLIAAISLDDLLVNRREAVVVAGRLADDPDTVAADGFASRWRSFLAAVNLYQFLPQFEYWTTSELENHAVGGANFAAAAAASEAWQAVLDEVVGPVRSFVEQLSGTELPVPEVEFFMPDQDDDAFAELAWPDASMPLAVLAGDQVDFAAAWQQRGWRVATVEEARSMGIPALAELIEAEGEE